MLTNATLTFGGVTVPASGFRIVLDDGEPVAKPEGATPKWQKLFPMNVTKFRGDFPDGRLQFTREMLGKLVANAKGIIAKGHQIQVNYHHLGGDSLDPKIPLENTVAAGWIQDVELREDGGWALMAWTERARKFIESDELKYLSPEFYLEYLNRDTGKPQGPTLVGAALTNTPFLKELPRVAASDLPLTAEPSANSGAMRMDKKKVCAALGLAEDTAEDVVFAKLSEMSQASKKLSDVGDAGVKLVETRTALVKMTEQFEAVSKEVNELKTVQRQGEIKTFCDKLVAEHRLDPKVREGVEALGQKHGIEAIKFYENAAPIRTSGEVGLRGEAPTGEDKKMAAQTRLDDRIMELRKKDPTLKFRDAHALALADMKDVRDLLYGATA